MTRRFFINQHWQAVPVKCSTCHYCRTFQARPDEPSNLGCRKPGWEGYTRDEKPICGGDFYYPKTEPQPANQ